jgi:hypothetical protein
LANNFEEFDLRFQPESVVVVGYTYLSGSGAAWPLTPEFLSIREFARKFGADGALLAKSITNLVPLRGFFEKQISLISVEHDRSVRIYTRHRELWGFRINLWK